MTCEKSENDLIYLHSFCSLPYSYLETHHRVFWIFFSHFALCWKQTVFFSCLRKSFWRIQVGLVVHSHYHLIVLLRLVAMVKTFDSLHLLWCDLESCSTALLHASKSETYCLMGLLMLKSNHSYFVWYFEFVHVQCYHSIAVLVFLSSSVSYLVSSCFVFSHCPCCIVTEYEE